MNDVARGPLNDALRGPLKIGGPIGCRKKLAALSALCIGLVDGDDTCLYSRPNACSRIVIIIITVIELNKL